MGRVLHLFQRRGACQQQNLVGDLGGGNPDLLAIDNVFVALANRAGFQLRGVQPGIGFGHRKAGLVATVDDRRQHARALFPGAEHDDGVETEHVHVHGGSAGHAGTRFCNRPHHDRGIRDAEAGAAKFFGDTDAEPAGVRQRLVKIGGIAAFLVFLQPIGIVEARADFCDRIADRFLVGG